MQALGLSHDLSEDYALFLLLLTAPDLPEIHEIDDVFCHISLRGAEHSIGMVDRRPWARDIFGHLDQLTKTSSIAGPGLWALLTQAAACGESPLTNRSVQDLRAQLSRYEREIALLQGQTARLRDALAQSEETAV